MKESGARRRAFLNEPSVSTCWIPLAPICFASFLTRFGCFTLHA